MIKTLLNWVPKRFRSEQQQQDSEEIEQQQQQQQQQQQSKGARDDNDDDSNDTAKMNFNNEMTTSPPQRKRHISESDAAGARSVSVGATVRKQMPSKQQVFRPQLAPLPSTRSDGRTTAGPTSPNALHSSGGSLIAAAQRFQTTKNAWHQPVPQGSSKPSAVKAAATAARVTDGEEASRRTSTAARLLFGAHPSQQQRPSRLPPADQPRRNAGDEDDDERMNDSSDRQHPTAVYIGDDALTHALFYHKLSTSSRDKTFASPAPTLSITSTSSLGGNNINKALLQHGDGQQHEGTLEESDIRALYEYILLDVVERNVVEVVDGFVYTTEGAMDALIRSLVVPMVTMACPTPRGVLRHIRSGAYVALPIELDVEDLNRLDTLFSTTAEEEGRASSSSSSWSTSFTPVNRNIIHSITGAVTSVVKHVSSVVSTSSSRTAFDEAFVIEDDGYQIRRYQLHTLMGKQWVNDQVINYYFHLLAKSFPDITSLGSHLYAKLVAGDVAGALRWVRRKNIFSSRVILIAINLSQNHWTLVVVDQERKCLDYFDSLHGETSYGTVLDRVAGFMDEAYAAMHEGCKPNPSYRAWSRNTDDERRAQSYDNIPRQSNGYDCGVFVTQFGLCAASGIAPDFCQRDISLLRNVLALELAEKKLLKRIAR